MTRRGAWISVAVVEKLACYDGAGRATNANPAPDRTPDLAGGG